MTSEKQDERGAGPDDPLLTAYAFGELEGEGLAAMEAAVAADPRLARRVAELRAFGDDLGAALEDEPAPAMSVPAVPAVSAPRARVSRFPAWAWAATGLAAGVAVLLSLRDSGEPASPNRDVVAVETVPAPMPMPTPAPAPAPPIEVVSPEIPVLNLAEKLFVPEEMITVVRDVQPAPEQSVAPEPIVAVPEPELPTMVVADAPKVGAPEIAIPALVGDSKTQVRAMLDKGRSQYVAGDLDAAVASFESVKKLDARNREAGYFSARIIQERERAREGMGAAKPTQRRRSSNTVVPADPVTTVRMPPSTPRSAAGRPVPRVVIAESGFIPAESRPVSTFSVDVDTASYSALRGTLRSSMQRMRFRPEEVRIEELINYFPYDYAPPIASGVGAEEPFAAHLAVASAPWASKRRLVRIGLKGMELASEERPAANLVFVVDISGSMMAQGGLSLVKVSLLQLVGRLRPDDHVAIVSFGTDARLVLPSTPVEQRATIQDAIRGLRIHGSTNAESGIELGYEVAQEHFRPDGINRVIFCTDGGFGARVKDGRALFELAREKARDRVFLTVLGFGMRMSVTDENLEQLADKGDGVYHHVDSVAEARKILGEEVEGTLATIAKDVKVRVEFNPERVSSYRLIGYENRALGDQDFADETVDAGDVGAGHAVTALYEIEPTGKRVRKRPAGDSSVVAEEDRLLTVKIRYKEPFSGADETRAQEFALADADVDFEDADEDFRFAASVAAWGMLLRDSSYKGGATFDHVRDWAKECLSHDPGGYREEFIDLVQDSRSLFTNRF